MEKVTWKPGTMLYLLPAVMVSCGAGAEEYNIIPVLARVCNACKFLFNFFNFQ